MLRGSKTYGWLSLIAVLAMGCPGPTQEQDSGVVDAAPSGVALTITPLIASFGDVGLGSSSEPLTLTVTNRGATGSAALRTSIEGMNPTSFSVATSTCTAALAPGATCTVGVRFTPQARGGLTGSFTVTDGSAMSVAQLQGNGAVGLSLTPTPHSFGATDTGQMSAPQTFTLRNDGTATTGMLSAMLTGPDAIQFAMGMDACSGMTLAAGASCTVEVTHRPTAAAMHTAALTLTVSPGGSVSAALSATGRTPAGLEITPATQDFGSIRVGMLSATVSFMVRNPGASPTPTLATAITGANASEFSIVSSTCTGMAVAGGGSCMVLARFAPDSTGDKTATLEVTGGALTGTANFTAIGAVGDLVATPSVQDFASIAIGSPSMAQDITISNMGAARSGTLGVTITGTNPGDFSVTNDRCAGNTLMPSATCTISVQFTPAMSGARAARLRVSGTPGGVATAALTGTGVAPAMLTATPTMSDFGSVALGLNSSDVVVTIENTGGAATSEPVVSISGANADEFTIVSNGCMDPLLAGETCTITLRFNPTSAGMKTATLDVTGTPGGTTTTTLVGTGITPAALGAMPTALNFASFPETMTTSALSVSISNGGMASTGPLALALSGADMGQFTVMSDACTGMVLAEAESCVVSIVFAPTSQGAKTASLGVTGMPGGTLNVALAGVGTPDIEIAPNPHDYGAIPVAMSADQIFVITNRTTTLRTFSTNVLGGADAAQFSFQAVTGSPPACSATTDLAAAPSPGGLGGQCRLTVRFAPTGFAGSRAASLSVTTTLGGAETAPINANAAGPVRIIGYRTVVGAAPACPVSGTVGLTTTSPVAFGDRTLGVTSPDIQVCVRNVSGAVSGIITTLPTYSGDLRIVADTCNGTNLAAGALATAQCSVVYRFFPRTEGAARSTLALRYGGNNVSTTVTGNGIAGPSIRVTGMTDFGAVIATQTAERTFTVTNMGSLPTAAIVFSVTTPGVSTRYTVVTGPGAGTCSSGVTVLPGGMSCTIVLRFAPVQADVERTALTRTLHVQQGTQMTDTALTGTSLSMLTVTPTTRTYTAPIGDTSVTEMYRIDNLGSVTAAVTIGFTAPANFLLSPTCTSVAPGASCTFGVYFRATAAGVVNSNANISFGAYAANPSARATVTMTGTGLPSPRLVLTPTPRAFGSAVVGSMTGTSTFTVTNTGGSPSLSITVSISSLPLDYTVVRNGCSGPLDAGASCTIDVRFNPTAAGARNGNLRAFAGTAEANAMLTGTGVTASSFTLTPNPYDFGSGPAGAAIGPVTFTATNNAAVAAAGTSVVVTGVDAARFLVTANTCTGSIAAGATCTFNLTFASPLAGPHRQSLVAAEVRTTTVAVATGVASISGTSLGPTAIDLTPNGPLALGTVAVGRTSSTVFTLTNTGGVTSAIPALGITGAAAAEYAIRANTCTAALAGGASCTFTLDLTPTSTGAKAAIVTATAGALSDSSAVSGTAVLEAVLSMTPGGAQTCADHASGTTTNCVTYTVSNTGGVPSAPLSISVTGDFALAGTCVDGAVLNNAATCTVIVVHTPTSVGSDMGTLSVSAMPGGMLTSTIGSNGISGLTLTAGVPAFGSTPVLGAGIQRVFTFTNAAGSPTTGVLDYAITGANPSDFAVVADTCVGITRAASTTCAVTVEFVPAVAGARSATLTVGDGTAEKLAVLAMTGTGM